jgi:hypothetical protein
MKHREKKSIIIWLFLTLFILISFSILIWTYIYPSILSIEDEKKVLVGKFKKYKELDLKWFNFTDFKKLNSTYNHKKIDPETSKEVYNDKELYDSLNEQFYKKVYKAINESFYNNSIYSWDYKNFSNTSLSFLDYLDKVNNKLNQVKSSEKFNDRKWKLSLVLPKYSNYIKLDYSDSLTDLKFISSLEILLRKFNLRTTSPIWIQNTIPVSSGIVSSKDNIFYIPLWLDIVWTKIGVLEFLDYIKSSWNIEFSENDFDFSNKNGEISQLVEVESLNLKQYIDTGLEKRSSSNYSLKEFLVKTWQSNDIINVNLNLSFYISGISSEKILGEINSIIWDNATKIKVDKYWNLKKDEETWEYELELLHYNYKNILKVVKILKGNTKLQKSAYLSKKVNNIFLYLNNKELKKEIVSVKKELKKTKDLNWIYLKVLKYKDIFLKLDKDIYNIVKSADIETNKVYPGNYIFE